MGFFNFANKFNNKQEDKRGFIDEDEWLVIQNDPEFKKALEYSLENKTDSDSLDQWIVSDKTWDNYMREPFDEYKESQISEENLPFDEQDITKTWKASADKQQWQRQLQKKQAQEKERATQKQIESLGEYSPDEFKLMQQCATYMFLFFVKGKKDISRPKLSTGVTMDDFQIKELSEEFREFKKTNPEKFAEMKVLVGDWKKKNIDQWNAREHKGKKNWTSKIGKSYYVSQEDLALFLKGTGNTFYFKEESIFRPQGKDVETVFVKLQMPLEKAR